MSSYLSHEFLSKYEGIRPKNAGPLFEVTYLSKYSRWLEDKKRRETWKEIIHRVVDYNVGLYSGHQGEDYLKKEAELMFDYLFHLKTYPAGRTYWIGGTEAAKKWPESNLNCCMEVIDSLEAFYDLFHLLMVGAGVGYRILKEDVAKLPKFHTNFSIDSFPYKWNESYESQSFKYEVEDTTFIEVGDSKEGWVKSLELFLTLLATQPPIRDRELKIVFDYGNVRPAGERIKTFGGRAAGHEGLKLMFEKLTGIIKASGGQLSPVDCMDICNIIAENVLVGGVRRSAQIALGSPDDQEFIDAKLNLFERPELKHRRKSNNTVVLKEKPSREKVGELLQRVKESWEPGFLNFAEASRRRPWFAAVNPCSEILGANRGNCNLAGSFINSHIEDGNINWDTLEKSHRLATRISLRQTNINLSLQKWNEVHKRDRLLGISITGLMDALDALGWDHESEEAIDLMKKLRDWSNDEAIKYAKEMRVNIPLLVTTIKPEGTISLLTTTSCGMHRSYAPQFIRRYKISNMDPLCLALRELGVPNEPDQLAPDRTVFEFYVDSGARESANDESARKQLTRYLNLMKYYVDHNASCTLTVGPDEWEEMGDMIHDNWDGIVAIALANKDMSENVNYVQLPYEALSKDQLKPNPDLSNLHELVNKYENTEYEEEDIASNTTSLECSALGSCPTR